MVSPLLPLLLSAAYMGDLERPSSSRLLDQDFGLGLRPEQLVLSRYGYYVPRERLLDVYFRPWAELLRPESGGGGGGGGVSSISLDDERFRVILDVQQFKPEEVEVKLLDKHVVVSAKHEEKKDEHGLVSRQFVRRYVLPENVDAEAITSSISSDGVLTIEAPVKGLPEDKNERKIKIEYTGKPALKRAEAEKKDHDLAGAGASSTTAQATDSSSSTTQPSTTPDE